VLGNELICLHVLANVQEKEGSRSSFGDSLIVCQALQTSSAECTQQTTVDESVQHTANDEPMRISLDFAKTDSDEEMCVQEEPDNVNVDSRVSTDCEHAASSS